jgi:hypothetical protein
VHPKPFWLRMFYYRKRHDRRIMSNSTTHYATRRRKGRG